MKKRFLFSLLFILISAFSVFSQFIFVRPHHPHHPYYPYYPSYVYIYTRSTVIHNLGNIYLDKDILGESGDIDSIVFSFGLDAAMNKGVYREIYFSDKGSQWVEHNIKEYLTKSEIPDTQFEYNGLKSNAFIENGSELKLTFLNSNSYRKYYEFDPDEYYLYDLHYNFIIPIDDSVKSQFDKMESSAFKNDINKFLVQQKKMRIAGVSVFITGMGLFGALNIAGLIVLANTVQYGSPPMIVPGSLFLSGLGALSFSLGIGVPLWVSSYKKKEFVINFNN